MWMDRVSNPGSLAYESDALPTALLSPAGRFSEAGVEVHKTPSKKNFRLLIT